MKKFTETVEKKVKENVEYHVANCINCNNGNIITENTDKRYDRSAIDYDEKSKPILIFNYRKGSDNEYGGECKNCGVRYVEREKNTFNFSTGICIDKGIYKYEAANVWNLHNDVDLLIANQQILIEKANDEIKRLKKIKLDNQ